MGEYTIFHTVAWPSTYAYYFFVIGISAALFFISGLSWFREEFKSLRTSSFYLSFVLLVAGGLLLIADLSQPMRFIFTLNPFYWNFASPLTWGSILLLLFGAASVAYFLAMQKNDEALARKLAVAGSLIALGLPIYTGFDLSVLAVPFGKQASGIMLASVLLLVGGMALRYSILMGPQIVHTYF